MKRLTVCIALMVVGASLAFAGGQGEPQGSDDVVTLTIESWRNDDLRIWQDQIIPAFNARNPDIQVIFQPLPPAEYNAALNARLEGGPAGVS